MGKDAERYKKIQKDGKGYEETYHMLLEVLVLHA